MLKSNSPIMINNEEYLFSNSINENKELLKSFNDLADDSFGIRFNGVGGEYEPHVLIKNGHVCANVSVNKVPFYYNGEKKLYIQLGTVMTDKKYRKLGLSRWLIETILNEWQDKCDAVYLFAADSVLNFYPKFNFVKEDEFEYSFSNIKANNSKLTKLNMDSEPDVELLQQKYSEGNPFSKFYMSENQAILSFYYTRAFKNNIYYIKDYDVVIIAGIDDNKLYCYEILGNTDASLKDIISSLVSLGSNNITLGFTPKDLINVEINLHKEEDTTLFINKCGENILTDNKLMFPIISHA